MQNIYGVKKAKLDELRRKMKSLNIKESEITEKFIRSSGAGGQKINKTSTCVYLKHEPTNTEVKCQKTRNQSLNRFFARRILIEKIENEKKGKISARQKRIFKIRKQKRRRSRKAKEKILENKKMQSEKKKKKKKSDIPPDID